MVMLCTLGACKKDEIEKDKPKPKYDKPAVYKIGVLPATISISGTVITVPNTITNEQIKKALQSGTVSDADGKAGITSIVISGNTATINFY